MNDLATLFPTILKVDNPDHQDYAQELIYKVQSIMLAATWNGDSDVVVINSINDLMLEAAAKAKTM